MVKITTHGDDVANVRGRVVEATHLNTLLQLGDRSVLLDLSEENWTFLNQILDPWFNAVQVNDGAVIVNVPWETPEPVLPSVEPPKAVGPAKPSAEPVGLKPVERKKTRNTAPPAPRPGSDDPLALKNIAGAWVARPGIIEFCLSNGFKKGQFRDPAIQELYAEARRDGTFVPNKKQYPRAQ